MTELCSVKARRFFRGHCFESARAVTTQTGIRALAPDAEMDDYVFEPCGYSMNGIQTDVRVHICTYTQHIHTDSTCFNGHIPITTIAGVYDDPCHARGRL